MDTSFCDEELFYELDKADEVVKVIRRVMRNLSLNVPILARWQLIEIFSGE